MPVKPEFKIDRQGQRFSSYEGLLDAAHADGLKLISTEIIQIPTDENKNVAICKATVETSKGIFTGIGDAAPNNVTRPMLNCLIRMAETRSKARALRDAVNDGATSDEELGGSGNVVNRSNNNGGQNAPAKKQAAPAPASKPNQPVTPQAQTQGLINDKQNKQIEQLQDDLGWSDDQIINLALSRYKANVPALTMNQAANFINVLEAELKKSGPAVANPKVRAS